LPSTITASAERSVSLSGCTPVPTNDVVVSPVEMSPEKPSRAVTAFTWGSFSSSARSPA